MSPFLTDAEVADMCAPLTNGAAQIRFLQREGLLVTRKPNGRPLVMRSELERVKGAGRFGAPVQNASATQPNRAALMQVIKGGRRGTQAQGQ